MSHSREYDQREDDPWPYGEEAIAKRERIRLSHPDNVEALQHAEAILQYCPQISTNCGGKGPSTTTGLALAKVRAALAIEEDASERLYPPKQTEAT